MHTRRMSHKTECGNVPLLKGTERDHRLANRSRRGSCSEKFRFRISHWRLASFRRSVFMIFPEGVRSKSTVRILLAPHN